MIKFLLTKGPGSPGKVTSTIIKRLNEGLIIFNKEDIPIRILLKTILIDRMNAAQLILGEGYYSKISNLESLLDFIEDDVPTLSFVVQYSETQKFRKSMVTTNYVDSSFNIVTEVIYEVAEKKCPIPILSYSSFSSKAGEVCNQSIYY